MSALYAYLFHNPAKTISNFCSEYSEGYDAPRQFFSDKLKLQNELDKGIPPDHANVQSKLDTICKETPVDKASTSPEKPPRAKP
jgi:hypothetical protein